MVRFLKSIACSPVHNPDILDTPCVNLGTRIAEQMYHGVDNGNSTLVTGQYDDDDDWDVDPACDMTTDRLTLEIRETIPVSDPSTPDGD